MRRVTNIDKSTYVTFTCSLCDYTNRQCFGKVDENNSFAFVLVRLSQLRNKKNASRHVFRKSGYVCLKVGKIVEADI